MADDKLPKCHFEAAKYWAKCRVQEPSYSGPNETERDDNLARCYLALSSPGLEALRQAAETLCDNAWHESGHRASIRMVDLDQLRAALQPAAGTRGDER